MIKGTGKKAGSDSDDFKAMAAELEANVACYLIFREFDPKVASKWVLCQYMPDSAMVNSKMLYASSRASLKEGFGASALTDDYFISDASEMTLDAFTKERTVVEDQQDLMTFNERAKSAAVRAEMSAMSESVQLTVADVPIKTSGEAKTAIENVKDGSNNLATLILETKTQELRADTANCLGNGSMEDVSKICTAQKEARFLLFRYEHKNPSGESKSTMVFMYYCPDEAPPRMKMMYSTCKSMVLRILEKLEVTVDSKVYAATCAMLSARPSQCIFFLHLILFGFVFLFFLRGTEAAPRKPRVSRCVRPLRSHTRALCPTVRGKYCAGAD